MTDIFLDRFSTIKFSFSFILEVLFSPIIKITPEKEMIKTKAKMSWVLMLSFIAYTFLMVDDSLVITSFNNEDSVVEKTRFRFNIMAKDSSLFTIPEINSDLYLEPILGGA